MVVGHVRDTFGAGRVGGVVGGAAAGDTVTAMAETAPRQFMAAGGWRELLGRDYLGAATVLAGGVAIYATNEFITMSLLPTAVTGIGGERLYSWVTTVYLVASVIAAASVGPALVRFGPRRSYMGALLSFGLGSVVCASAPTMTVFLAGRVVQGLAGGLLAGLGYAVISAVLPERLWTRASALVSAMWGVGTLVGPASGGLLAQFGWWRSGFVVLAVAATAMAVLVPLALPRGGGDAARIGVPLRSLVLLGTAALVVSVAALAETPVTTAALLVVAVAIVVAFVVVDRRVSVAVLPRSVFGPGPLKWIYLTLGVLMAATMADMYVPLFGQRLGGMVPAAAGFLGAALSVGWTVGEIASASVSGTRAVRRIVVIAPVVMASGLALAALVTREPMTPAVMGIWAVGLVMAGSGIGMAWPHLSAWAMGSVVDDPAEQAVAAAAINTVQLMCGAFGAGLAGVVVNLHDAPGAGTVRWMFGLFAVFAALAWVTSSRAARPAG
jgi:MFS family permease